MPFISSTFILFFALFFLLYWFAGGSRLSWQNGLLLLGSYTLYTWMDHRFILLLAGSSLLHYFLGIQMHRSANKGVRTLLLAISLAQGIGCLIFFKYVTLLLPLGISFYTFKTLGYLLDIRKGKTQPVTNLPLFLTYVSFFPCIVAGPIDRAEILIPQLEKKRTFQYLLAVDGMRQILWGLFKKIVIADNCTTLCGDIFDHYRSMPASALWYGAFLATIWVYADFSGYSDLAIGFSKLLGLEVTRNFNYPFFANNIAQFWRRWHISLTSWMTEYVFTPLTIAFRDLGKGGSILAVLITFTLIGCWHGPKWTFFVYGLANGCLYIPLILRGTMNKKGSRWGMPLTWLLLLFSYILFRCDTLTQALGYYRGLFSASLFSRFPITEKIETLATLTGITIMLFAEWRQQDKEHALQIGFIRSFLVRALIYFGLIAFILTFGPHKNADFIYLKF